MPSLMNLLLPALAPVLPMYWESAAEHFEPFLIVKLSNRQQSMWNPQLLPPERLKCKRLRTRQPSEKPELCRCPGRHLTLTAVQADPPFPPRLPVWTLVMSSGCSPGLSPRCGQTKAE